MSVKTEHAQEKRAMQMAEHLLATVEAGQAHPPLIATAFRRQPKAAAGCGGMIETQRRFELMGVFYYQTRSHFQAPGQALRTYRKTRLLLMGTYFCSIAVRRKVIVPQNNRARTCTGMCRSSFVYQIQMFPLFRTAVLVQVGCTRRVW